MVYIFELNLSYLYLTHDLAGVLGLFFCYHRAN
nr:MAG TPA: hypothetical protein [Herelleviridae sp.]